MTLGELARRLIHQYSWDTRCRNADVLRVLKAKLVDRTTVLDAGCGENGIANFTSAMRFTGVDINIPSFRRPGFKFVKGSILDLPFSDNTFSFATSVDVLEHLSPKMRKRAIHELIRVAQKGIVLAFPCGTNARRIDENFRVALEESNRPIPSWLDEHMKYDYPLIESVMEYIKSSDGIAGAPIHSTVIGSEQIRVTEALRKIAVKSSRLYVVVNLLAGVLLPLFPRPLQNKSYRSILLVEFV